MPPFAALLPGMLWGTADPMEDVWCLGLFPWIPRVCQVFSLSLGFPLLKQLYNTISGCWFASALRCSVYIQHKKYCAEVITGTNILQQLPNSNSSSFSEIPLQKLLPFSSMGRSSCLLHIFFFKLSQVLFSVHGT